MPLAPTPQDSRPGAAPTATYTTFGASAVGLRAALIAALLLLPAAAGAMADREVDNARYGEALFQFYQGKEFTAITHLLAARSQGRITTDWDEAELMLGGLKLSYGLTDAAEKIFTRLLAGAPSESVRQQAWYYLARVAHEKGRLDQAAHALAQMGDQLPPKLRGQQQLLDALVRMRQGDFAGAAQVLQPWQGVREDEDYGRYNLGVALVRSGRLEQGAEVLARLGDAPVRGEEAQALRDKANLALGRALLEDSPERARESLDRVRLQGPLSNKALLGAGWAEAVAGDYRAALTPWTELKSRELSDPAVQEAMLALPYALLQLNARGQAAELYREAVIELDAEAGRLQQAMDAVQRGELLDAALRVDPRGNALPPLKQVPGSAYLGSLLTGNGFRRALQDYKEIESLQANLRYWRQHLDDYEQLLAANRDRFEQRLAGLDARLQALDAAALEARRRELALELPAARFTAVDAALEKLHRQQRALAGLPAEAHKNFRGMGGRIRLLRDRIDALLPRLDDALAQRRRLLELRALQALGERRDSLRSQVTQARFALAQLYDPAGDRAEGPQ